MRTTMSTERLHKHIKFWFFVQNTCLHHETKYLEMTTEHMRFTETISIPSSSSSVLRRCSRCCSIPFCCTISFGLGRPEGQLLGALQRDKIPKIRYYYGSGWVGPDVGFFFFFFKSSQNSPKPVLIFWRSIPCVFLSVYC